MYVAIGTYDIFIKCINAGANPEGDRGSGHFSPGKSKNIGFLSNTDPDQSYQANIQCWAIIGINGVSLADR